MEPAFEVLKRRLIHREKLDFLVKEGDFRRRRRSDRAFVQWNHSCNGFEERGFSAAVRTCDKDSVAFADALAET